MRRSICLPPPLGAGVCPLASYIILHPVCWESTRSPWVPVKPRVVVQTDLLKTLSVSSSWHAYRGFRLDDGQDENILNHHLFLDVRPSDFSQLSDPSPVRERNASDSLFSCNSAA